MFWFFRGRKYFDFHNYRWEICPMNRRALPVWITDRALEEIGLIRQTKNIPPDYGLRIGSKGGGCAGVSYFIGFDRARSGDEVFEGGGFEILIEKKHFMHLLGLQVDFIDTDHERGFLFSSTH
jgi:iron-sulfur cluster assembly protein